jgi:hypothetical protein
MKLAELLIERAECQNKIAELKMQILSNLKVQEGDTPSLNTSDLLSEFARLNSRLEQLVVAINTANSKTQISSGKTLTEAIAQRDAIKAEIDFYKDIVRTANIKDYRVTRSEIKMTLTVDLSYIVKEIDSLSKMFRLLDNEIQQVNWTVDI